MTFITGLNKPQGNQRRNISVINANFDLIADVVNGDLDDANIAPDANIQGAKLKVESIPMDRMSKDAQSIRASSNLPSVFGLNVVYQTFLTVPITQPNPGMTIVYWQVQYQSLSGSESHVRLMFGGSIMTEVTSPGPGGVPLWQDGGSQSKFEELRINAPGNQVWSLTGATNGGTGQVTAAAIRILTFGF